MVKLMGLAEFKQRAGITGDKEDQRLDLLIEDVSARIQSKAGRLLERLVHTDEKHTPGGQSFEVKHPPIDTTQPVVLKEESPFVAGILFPIPTTVISQPVTFTDNEFEVDAEDGKIWLKFREFTPHRYPSIIVTYTGGYAKEGQAANERLLVPSELVRATFLQTFYEHKHHDELGLAGVSVAGASVTLAPAELLPEVRRIIDIFDGRFKAG